MTRAATALVALLVSCGLPVTAAVAAPQISAPSAIVQDAVSGEVLYERAADSRRPIASTTKLMTALLVLERSRLSDVVPAARYRALAVESKLGLRPGERMTVADLLRGLLIASANDAAVTLAQHVSRTPAAFVGEMNRRAAALGLRDTRFANPVGLDAPGNYSTARDLVKLTLALRAFPFFRRVVDTRSTTLESGARPRTIVNRNQLVREVDEVDGVKTGRTQGAGYVLVGSATRRRIRLISVVLGTPSEAARNVDSLKLLRFGFSKYRVSTAVARRQVLGRVPIRFRTGAELDLVASRTVRRSIRRGSRLERRVMGAPQEVEGPIREGQRLGTIEIFLDGRRVSRVPLVAASSVAEAGTTRRAKEFLTRPSTLGLLAVAVLASFLTVSVARRARSRGTRRTESRGAPAA